MLGVVSGGPGCREGGDARQDVGAGKGRGVFNVIVAGHELGHDGDGVFLALGQLEGACQPDDAGAEKCEFEIGPVSGTARLTRELRWPAF